MKDPENPRHWIVDPVAADVVKRIFSMYMEGSGPLQIAKQLKADKVLTPTAYKELQGIKSPNKKSENPYAWGDRTVVHILERWEYTGYFRGIMEEQLRLESTEQIRIRKKRLEHNERRIAELKKLFIKIYEDNASGRLNDERYDMLSRTYETEQK